MIPMTLNNELTLLKNGDTYFPSIIAAIDGAKQEIYLETYIFKIDKIGRCISEALRRAALRGVNTRLLMDGFGSVNFPKSMLDSLSADGIRIRKFRPKTSPWTLRRRRLRRLHRKILVVDRKIAFVGGINIIDDLDGPGERFPRFDYAVRIEGPLAAEIHRSARDMWLQEGPKHLKHRAGPDIGRRLSSSETGGALRAAFLIRNNIRNRRDIENAYLEAIEQARSEIILANAFFLPGLNFRHALLDAARRGVCVTLLLQGRVEYRLMHYATHALYGSFLAAGIEIFEYYKSLMHAKVAVIDGRWATVGSSNLDPFSLLLSLEGNVVIEDETFAASLKHSLNQAIESDSRRILPNNWRNQPFHMRLTSWLSYGIVRFLIGIAGYAPGKTPGPIKTDR